MTRNGTSLEVAHASVKELIAEKLKYLVPMTIISAFLMVAVSALTPQSRPNHATLAKYFTSTGV